MCVRAELLSCSRSFLIAGTRDCKDCRGTALASGALGGGGGGVCGLNRVYLEAGTRILDREK